MPDSNPAHYMLRRTPISRASKHGGEYSAVAAAAYRLGERLYDARRGEYADYSSRDRVVRELHRVILPANAPAEYVDPETLWNAAEAAERSDNARVAADYTLAAPIELLYDDPSYGIVYEMGCEMAQALADKGMCVQVATHGYPGDLWVAENNPHLHLLATVRAIETDGSWAPKTRKAYLMRDPSRDVDDRYVLPDERKLLEAEGWEPVYQYDDHGRRARLTLSQAEARGLDKSDRTDRHPVSRKVNTVDWDTEEHLREVRELWERICNRHLVEHGHDDHQVSCRSYADQGLDIVPTLHEGHYAHELEREARAEADRLGIDYVPVTNVGLRNEVIREVNAEINRLKEQPIPVVTEALGERDGDTAPVESVQQRDAITELVNHGLEARLDDRYNAQTQEQREELRQEHRGFMGAIRERIASARDRAAAAMATVRDALRQLPEHTRAAVRTIEQLTERLRERIAELQEQARAQASPERGELTVRVQRFIDANERLGELRERLDRLRANCPEPPSTERPALPERAEIAGCEARAQSAGIAARKAEERLAKLEERPLRNAMKIPAARDELSSARRELESATSALDAAHAAADDARAAAGAWDAQMQVFEHFSSRISSTEREIGELETHVEDIVYGWSGALMDRDIPIGAMTRGEREAAAEHYPIERESAKHQLDRAAAAVDDRNLCRIVELVERDDRDPNDERELSRRVRSLDPLDAARLESWCGSTAAKLLRRAAVTADIDHDRDDYAVERER